jgi:hypothetical protein
MAARTRREPDALLLQFERDGEEPERKLAHGGRQALLFAIGMLIGHTRLMAGDRLTVSAADSEAESPASR